MADDERNDEVWKFITVDPPLSSCTRIFRPEEREQRKTSVSPSLSRRPSGNLQFADEASSFRVAFCSIVDAESERKIATTFASSLFLDARVASMRVGGVSSSVNYRIFRFFEETLLRASVLKVKCRHPEFRNQKNDVISS